MSFYNLYHNLSTINLLRVIIRKVISRFIIKYQFKSCDDIYLASGYQINGAKNIRIGSLSAGRDLRLEALTVFGNQIFKLTISIGKKVSFGNYCHIAAVNNIEIGDNCLFGSGAYITDHDHGVYSTDIDCSAPGEPPAHWSLDTLPVSIGTNVFVGEQCVILKGISIGCGVIIGAYSVVTRNIEDNCIVVGNLAKVIKKFNPKTNVWEKI